VVQQAVVAFIEITEPGASREVDVAGDGVGLAVAVAPAGLVALARLVALAEPDATLAGPVAVADAVAGPDELTWAVAARPTAALAVGPGLAEIVSCAVPSARETAPPQPFGRQLPVRAVAAWPGQTRNTPTARTAIPATVIPTVAPMVRNRCGTVVSSRCRPGDSLP
jgi:hypothetical protein